MPTDSLGTRSSRRAFLVVIAGEPPVVRSRSWGDAQSVPKLQTRRVRTRWTWPLAQTDPHAVPSPALHSLATRPTRGRAGTHGVALAMWRDWARRRTREPAGDELQDTLLRREEAPANDEEAQEVRRLPILGDNACEYLRALFLTSDPPLDPRPPQRGTRPRPRSQNAAA